MPPQALDFLQEMAVLKLDEVLIGVQAEEARIFDAAMTGKAVAEIRALLSAFDFSRYGVIADVGGGRGAGCMTGLA